MADNEKGEEGTSRGADWEVVSLTASTYAAAPGPNEFDPTDESNEKENKSENDSSDALFLSGHFVFPPNEHENLPIEPDLSEIHNETEEHHVSPGVVGDDNGFDNPGKESLQAVSDEDQRGFEFFDKACRLSAHDIVFEEGVGFQNLNLVGMEQDMVADSESVDIHSGAHKNVTKFESEEPSGANMDSPRDHTKPNEDEFSGSNFPCQAWWKRHATSLYRQAKEANTFWSVVVAAAVMGLVILGRRWQRDKSQLHQLKWRFSINDERMCRMLGPIGRFKDVLVGGHQPNSLIRGVGA